MHEREEVLREFYRADAFRSSVDMADEIVRLRRALAARDAGAVTEAMVDAAARAWFTDPHVTFDSCSDFVQNWHREQARIALTAALSAALAG